MKQLMTFYTFVTLTTANTVPENLPGSTYLLRDSSVSQDIAAPLSKLFDFDNHTLVSFMLILLVFFSATQIISNRKLKKSKGHIKVEKERYKTLFELTSDVLWEYSLKDDVFTKTDPDLGIRTGLAETPNYGEFMRSHEIVFKEDLPIFDAFYEDMRNGTKKINYEFRAKTIAGNYEWFEMNGITIYNSNNEPFLVIGQTTNIHDRKQLISDLTESIENDELTKVYNRTALEHKINDSLSNPKEEKGMCAFFLLDIDHFEEINSKYGYVFGDALLLELATKLKTNYERTDAIIGRIGGDEFIVYLPSLSSKLHAEKEALCILTIINDILVKQGNSDMVTARIGIALSPPETTSFERLLIQSDTALFHSKQQHANSYMFYNPDTMSLATYMEPSNTTCVTAYKSKQYNYSLIDSKLIAQAVEILSDAREIESSINMILGILGTFYHLNYVGIIVENEQTKEGEISHEWRSSTTVPWNSNTTISVSDMDQFAAYNSQNYNYFVTNDMMTVRTISETAYVTLSHFNIKGFLECDINEQSAARSYITYCFNTPDRLWEQHEIDTLLLVAKILGGYLNNLQTQKKAEWMQKTDPVTGCNNLTTFNEEARSIILNNPSNRYIIFYSDIDKFKLINENHGYTAGDHILIEFANAMRSITDSDETFGRIAADKFVGLFRFDNPKHFLAKIKALNDYMNTIPSSSQSNYRISIIIGLCPVDSYKKMSLNIDQANMARKSITNRHKSRYAFFNEIMKKKLINQHEIEDQMELSLQNNDFKVYYQPKFNLKTNEISGAEALVRWQHPVKGLIPPDSFIPIFEENQFILKLDFYVFEHVCKHIKNLMDLGKKVHPVSVNFSRVHLNDSSMIEKLQTIIDKYDVPPHYLEIELTESALQSNHSNMYNILIKLHKMGFKISMDDFGSGLSSLNLLRTLPCDVLKLDKEFFQQGTSTERERIVITMIVKMAQDLHMTIVSEGVETEEQAEFLRSIHCDLAQGYLFAKPMPRAEYERIYYDL